MQCDVCHTEEATVHLTEIINDKVTKLHLCEQCAKEKSQEMEEHFGLADLLSGLADLAPISPHEEKIAGTDIKCPACSFTFKHFRKMGRLGCPECYETFKNQLNPLLKKIHGSENHTGKIKVMKEGVRDKGVLLGDLRMRLEKAVKLEEFEEAARLRDRIKVIETQRKK